MTESPFWLPTMPHFPEAACKEISNPDIFFPAKARDVGKVIDEVREICAVCPHAKECIEFALDEEIFDGIWAGYTPTQRKRMRPIRKVKHRSDLGERVHKLREQGLTFREVADALGTTTWAAQKAVTRYRLETKETE